ncbi:MAG: zinc-binding alcohol dehydrogenase family protein [Nocardioides sp.]
MRAAVVHTPGVAPAYADHPDPAPAPGQSTLMVSAAPVVPLDLLCASGTSYFGVPATPYVPGVQGVGIVEQSETFAAGTRVWFSADAGMKPGDGSLGELCAVPDRDVVPIETDLPDAAVAAIGLSGIAAWMALTWRAALREGERVLVLGGGGAVGQAGIGVARSLGASRVVAVARSPQALARAERAGADEVVEHVDDAVELGARMSDAMGGPADVVLDPVFGTAATAAGRLLAEGGRLVNLGGASGDEARFSSAALRSKTASVLGYTNNAITADQRRDALVSVLRRAEAGQVVVAHDTMTLSDVADAWARVLGGTAARAVLTP